MKFANRTNERKRGAYSRHATSREEALASVNRRNTQLAARLLKASVNQKGGM